MAVLDFREWQVSAGFVFYFQLFKLTHKKGYCFKKQTLCLKCFFFNSNSEAEQASVISVPNQHITVLTALVIPTYRDDISQHMKSLLSSRSLYESDSKI